MSKKTIAVMCSGSVSVGMGHIMRTLVIADKMKERFNIIYIRESGKEYGIGEDKIKKSGYSLYSDEDKVYADTLIADTYDMTEDKLSKLRKRYNRLIYIDDLHCLSFYDCDMIINKNFNAENLIYKAPPECKKLLGTKYALLRYEFQTAHNITIKEKAENVLITMGGTDPENTSVKILNILKSEPYIFNVAVSRGFSERTKSELEYLAAENDNIVLHKDPEMADLISKCDFAVTANGGTTHEIASLGVPQIAVSVAENQNMELNFGENNGMLVYGGKEEDIIPEKFLSAFNSLISNYEKRKQLSESEKNTVNKNGIILVEKEIVKLLDFL